MGAHTRRGRVLAAAGAACGLAAIAALAVGVRAQQSPPLPPAVALPANPGTGTPVTGDSPGSTGPSPAAPAPAGPAGAPGRPSAPAPPRGPVLPAAAPVRLDIPAIGVSTAMHPLGLNADRTVQVPPLTRDSWAGWYRYSPAPGQLGPAVVLGHIDSARYGPGVFFKLGALRPGDMVNVTRTDHTVAVFAVNRVAEFPKDHFPTIDVYGNTDRAALRLITCGGRFDLGAHSYEDNIVAFASLVSAHAATAGP